MANMTFNFQLQEFKTSVENKISGKRFHPIKLKGSKPGSKKIGISSHDALGKKLMYILDSSLTSLFPEEENMEFVPRPNQSDEHSDLYYEISNEDEDGQLTYSKVVAEIKTRRKIEFNVPNVIEEYKFNNILLILQH